MKLALLLLFLGGLERPTRMGPPPPAQVKRVVTLAPSLTELVLALNRGDALVGVSRFDELPEVARLPRVGGFVDPSVEAVVALQPELVLAQTAPGNRGPVERIAELGIPVLALPLHTVADIRFALLEVGKVLGASAPAAELVKALDEARARARESAKGQPRLRVLFVYGFEPLVVAGPASFAGELLGDVGAVNAADGVDRAYSVFSVERAVRARADVVIDASDTGQGKEKLRELPGLREARWVKVPSRRLMQPGPGLAKGLEELVELLRGEANAGARARDGGRRATSGEERDGGRGGGQTEERDAGAVRQRTREASP
jgi:iron complex transport system substrate-binding protein